MPKRMRLLSAIVLSLGTTSVFAQPLPKCDGDVAIVRLSEIKPGSMNAFLRAQGAHLDWYRNNGFTTNQIFAARVMILDPKTHMPTGYSDAELLTFHVNPPSQSTSEVKTKDPAGWDAYVKLYRDSSDVKMEKVVCIPKNG